MLSQFAVATLRLVQFLKINILRGSVATLFTYVGNFSDRLVANRLPSLSVKEF